MLEENVDSVVSHVERVLKLDFLGEKMSFTVFIRCKVSLFLNVNFTSLPCIALIRNA